MVDVEVNKGVLQGEQKHVVHPAEVEVEGKPQEPIFGPGIVGLCRVLRLDEGAEGRHDAEGNENADSHHLCVVREGVQHLQKRCQSVVVLDPILHLRPSAEDGSHLEDGEDALRRKDDGPDDHDEIRRGGDEGGEVNGLVGVGGQAKHPAQTDADVEEGGKEAVPDVQKVHGVEAGPPT